MLTFLSGYVFQWKKNVPLGGHFPTPRKFMTSASKLMSCSSLATSAIFSTSVKFSYARALLIAMLILAARTPRSRDWTRPREAGEKIAAVRCCRDGSVYVFMGNNFLVFWFSRRSLSSSRLAHTIRCVAFIWRFSASIPLSLSSKGLWSNLMTIAIS